MISLLLPGICPLLFGQDPANGSAAPDAATQEFFSDWAQAGSGEPGMTRVILALVVVLFLIFMISYLIKRYLVLGSSARGKGRLKLLETLPLGGRRMVHVLKVWDRTLVVGVTQNRIELLTELSDDESESGHKPLEKKGFGDILPLKLGRGRHRAANGEERP